MAANPGYTAYLNFRMVTLWLQLGVVTLSQSNKLRDAMSYAPERFSWSSR